MIKSFAVCIYNFYIRQFLHPKKRKEKIFFLGRYKINILFIIIKVYYKIIGIRVYFFMNIYFIFIFLLKNLLKR